MIFSDDMDLQRVQPSVFEHGVSSFEDYHEVAGDEIVQDLRKYWLQKYHIISVNIPSWWDKQFNPEKLNTLQWNTAAVYRVLGWHVLPMLHQSITLEGTTISKDGMSINELMNYYKKEYDREFNHVLQYGLEYDLGSGYEVVNRSSIAELQRLRR